MHFLVHVLALNCERIFRPYILYMNQRTLPLTENKMLQGGELQKIIFFVHSQPFERPLRRSCA
jgi:hypothetical protein